MTSSPRKKNGGAWGPLNEAWKFRKTLPNPKKHIFQKRWRFFLVFFGEVVGTSHPQVLDEF